MKDWVLPKKNAPAEKETADRKKVSDDVYEKMLEEVAKRRKVNKSIWTDEPVIPVRKSIWLDDEKPDENTSAVENGSDKSELLKPITAVEPKTQPFKNNFVLKIPKEYYEEYGVPKAPVQILPDDENPGRASGGRTVIALAEKSGFKQTVELSVNGNCTEENTLRNSSEQQERKSSRISADEKEYSGKLEQGFNMINSVLCILVIFGVGASLIFMHRESGFINSENRNLAKFPQFSLSSYLSGEYTEGITEYYTDTIPNREKLKKFSSVFFGIFWVYI